MKELKVKVGDKVFDSFFFEGIEGVITGIDNDPISNYNIRAKFAGVNYFYDVYGCRKSTTRLTLSLEPYEVNLNIITEKVETFKFGDDVLWLNDRCIFLKYYNDTYALIAHSDGFTISAYIKDLVKI
jgi:hypothetical protein